MRHLLASILFEINYDSWQRSLFRRCGAFSSVRFDDAAGEVVDVAGEHDALYR